MLFLITKLVSVPILFFCVSKSTHPTDHDQFTLSICAFFSVIDHMSLHSVRQLMKLFTCVRNFLKLLFSTDSSGNIDDKSYIFSNPCMAEATKKWVGLSLPSPSLRSPRHSAPPLWIQLWGLGERCKLPQQVWAEPGHQTSFGESKPPFAAFWARLFAVYCR